MRIHDGSRRRVGQAATVVVAALPALILGLALPAAAPTGGEGQPSGTPLIIAHRGASGERPEHTLEAYDLAIKQGADFIEPDLVITKDGVLIARHENEIGQTTDVADRFPDRKTTKRVDGREVTGWFAEDFTIAEIRTLRARERLAFRSKAFDGQFAIPTFEEVIDLARRRGRDTGRVVGVYPETKHPTYFRGIGLPLEEPLVATLDKHGLANREAPVFIQSFEIGNLQRLRTMTRVRLVQLLSARGRPFDMAASGGKTTYADMVTPGGLKEVATYADGVGPERRLIVPAAPDGTLLEPTSLVKDAHAAGLVVHVWTLRDEPVFLSPSYEGDPQAEYRQFAALGVDGIFTDFPATAVAALRSGKTR
jgi:glycerophosphoryl diester phosphodiesterase